MSLSTEQKKELGKVVYEYLNKYGEQQEPTKPTSKYLHRFTVDESPKDSRIKLSFEDGSYYMIDVVAYKYPSPSEQKKQKLLGKIAKLEQQFQELDNAS
jgi:hypothetical protein